MPNLTLTRLSGRPDVSPSNSAKGQCNTKGAIYKISYSGCGETYIGETRRPLNERFKEYLADNHNNARQTLCARNVSETCEQGGAVDDGGFGSRERGNQGCGLRSKPTTRNEYSKRAGGIHALCLIYTVILST